MVASHMHSNGNQTHNLGMCPDWELNLHFGVWDDARTNQANRLRLTVPSLNNVPWRLPAKMEA